MGRGQYDRAAAQAKRTVSIPPDYEALVSTVRTHGGSVFNPHGQPISQADYDALVRENDRLKRLCQTHGLMI